jgi:hypothetical protein
MANCFQCHLEWFALEAELQGFQVDRACVEALRGKVLAWDWVPAGTSTSEYKRLRPATKLMEPRRPRRQQRQHAEQHVHGSCSGGSSGSSNSISGSITYGRM